MSKLQPVRGTHDCLGEQSRLRRWIVEQAWQCAQCFGAEEVATPIFEFTSVFARSLGESSDVVTKEMYSFDDRGGESLTLRPEFTAAISRAVISGGLYQHLPMKTFSFGPVFRYERPQKGRMRQFHQINVEYVGIESPLADVELIDVGHQMLSKLGLKDRVTLELNSLGDAQSRDDYRAALVGFLQPFKDELSEDSKKRLEKNPLRILDSKDENDRRIIADAPRLADHYSDDARRYFNVVQDGLNKLDINYTLNPALVRGLDYYAHTAFEFTTTELGAQSAVLAGGRYDGLMEMMGGKPTPAIGFAAGMERLEALVNKEIAPPRPLVVVPQSAELEETAFRLAQQLRHEGVVVQYDFTGSMKKRLQRAGKQRAWGAVIVGEEEWKRGDIMMKWMDKGMQEALPVDGLVRRLKNEVIED